MTGDGGVPDPDAVYRLRAVWAARPRRESQETTGENDACECSYRDGRPCPAARSSSARVSRGASMMVPETGSTHTR